MEILTDVEKDFKDDIVSGTVVIQSVIEISKQDYDAYNIILEILFHIREDFHERIELNIQIGRAHV